MFFESLFEFLNPFAFTSLQSVSSVQFSSVEHIVAKVLLENLLVRLLALVVVFEFGAHRIAAEVLQCAHLPERVVAQADAASLCAQRSKRCLLYSSGTSILLHGNSAESLV